MTTDSVYLSPAPLYHAAPLRFCMSTEALGATVVVMDHFDAETFLQQIERHRVTHTQVVPTMFVRLLKLPEEVRARYDVSSLQYVVHAAAPCPVPVKQQMIEWFGPVLHEYYAGTEGNGFVYCNSEQWLDHPGTVGAPIGCTLHIVGDDGEELPTGESGTIYFEGGAQFEYHNDPEKTRSSRHPKGWSTLGDVGYVDDDGFLFLTDRKAYMIISGGVNIYPQEAENVLVTHPKVVDVAVFGVPNDDFGEEVKAVVQPVEMPADDEEADALAKELIAFCRRQPGRRQVPTLGRLPRRAPPPPDRQALQAPPQRRVLERRRPQHLTFLTLLAPAQRDTGSGERRATSTGGVSAPTSVPSSSSAKRQNAAARGPTLGPTGVRAGSKLTRVKPSPAVTTPSAGSPSPAQRHAPST